MIFRSLALIAASFAPLSASAQLPDLPGFGQDQFLKSFEDAAEFTAEFSPAKAKPGQEVTLKLTISPKIGCWTYPGNPRSGQTGVNTFVLPDKGDVLFLQKFDDPKGHKIKKGGGDWYYPEEVVWNFKAIVNPSATPGKKKIDLEGTRLQVCNSKN